MSISNKDISISNGQGTANIPNGSYSATASALGYDSNTLSPVQVTVSAGVDVYNFTNSGQATLTFHVTENGTLEGTPVPNAVFYRCDSSGNTYGSAVTTDSTGTATLSNLPYTSDGITIYYKQTATNDSHEFDSTVKSYSMNTIEESVEVTNPLAALRTINLVEENYGTLPVPSATITLS